MIGRLRPCEKSQTNSTDECLAMPSTDGCAEYDVTVAKTSYGYRAPTSSPASFPPGLKRDSMPNCPWAVPQPELPLFLPLPLPLLPPFSGVLTERGRTFLWFGDESLRKASLEAGDRAWSCTCSNEHG